jgi:hypothetical protein
MHLPSAYRFWISDLNSRILKNSYVRPAYENATYVGFENRISAGFTRYRCQRTVAVTEQFAGIENRSVSLPYSILFWLHYSNFVSNPAFMILHNVQVSNLLPLILMMMHST